MDGIIVDSDGKKRCWWGDAPSVYRDYHDQEWGMPVDDDFRLFEKICLEGFQAGLSWLTILRKREDFRRVFDGFDIARVARFTSSSVDLLVQDASIVRHRGKISSTINNAQRALELVEEFGSLAAYFWRFEPLCSARPERIDKATLMTLDKTHESSVLSMDLKKRGWTFVGPTTVYAFMQAMGLVNDHLTGCDAWSRVEEARQAFVRPC